MEEERMEDVVLPGFRFHPTDEELVGFYLRRKIQQKPLSIELIKQLDIYKFDPWDLPKLATTGEKEWYFYCPRDRKYRNSARPNRVTTAGFWKATGTDRPIYSSENGKCIGLKKSLVFYKGRAAKGIKTDWMMHEFRLPSAADAKKPLDKKNIPPNDSWAICRIFKKTSSMAAQRALSHSWAAQLPEPSSSDIYYGSCCNVDVPQPSVKEASTACSTSHLNAISSTPTLPPAGFCFSPAGCNPDMASILMNLPPALVFGDQVGRPPTTIDFNQNIESCTDVCFLDEGAGAVRNNVGIISHSGGHHWQASFTLAAPPGLVEAWRASTQWDPMPCPSEIPSGYVAKCYT